MAFSDKQQLEEFITSRLIINNTESYFSSSRIFPYGWKVLSKCMKNNEKEKRG